VNSGVFENSTFCFALFIAVLGEADDARSKQLREQKAAKAAASAAARQMAPPVVKSRHIAMLQRAEQQRARAAVVAAAAAAELAKPAEVVLVRAPPPPDLWDGPVDDVGFGFDDFADSDRPCTPVPEGFGFDDIAEEVDTPPVAPVDDNRNKGGRPRLAPLDLDARLWSVAGVESEESIGAVMSELLLLTRTFGCSQEFNRQLFDLLRTKVLPHARSIDEVQASNRLPPYNHAVNSLKSSSGVQATSYAVCPGDCDTMFDLTALSDIVRQQKLSELCPQCQSRYSSKGKEFDKVRESCSSLLTRQLLCRLRSCFSLIVCFHAVRRSTTWACALASRRCCRAKRCHR